MVREYLRQISRFSPAARLYLAGQALAGVGMAAVWVLRNLFLKKAGFGEAFIGNTLSATAVGTLAIVLPMTFLMDRRGLRGVLVGGALCLAAGLAAIALFPQPIPVVVASFFTGVGSSTLSVSMSPFFMKHSSPSERPYLFGVGNALGPMAGLLGTVGVQVGAHFWGENLASYRGMMLVGAGIAFLSSFVLAAVRDPSPEVRAGISFRDFDWATTGKLCLPEFVVGCGAGLTIPFINLYFQNRFHREAGDIGMYFSLAQGASFVAFLIAPILARRFGGVKTIVACQYLSIPFFLTMAFAMSIEVAVAAFLARHALMNMAQPVSSNFAMEILPPHQRALTNGLKMISWNAAWVVTATAGGYVVSRYSFVRDGFTITMLVTIALYLTGSTIYWLTFRRAEALSPRVEVQQGRAAAG